MTALPLHARQTALYRLFAADGALLYVGITCNPKVRMRDHRAEKPWWPEVARTTTMWHHGRVAALLHEARAIDEEAPRYNTKRPDPNRVPRLKIRPKIAPDETPRMSYEHAAAVLRLSADTLRRATEAGIIPHSCRGSSVWFTPKNVRHVWALFLPGPWEKRYFALPGSICAEDWREAKRALWLRHCLHAVI